MRLERGSGELSSGDVGMGRTCSSSSNSDDEVGDSGGMGSGLSGVMGRIGEVNMENELGGWLNGISDEGDVDGRRGERGGRGGEDKDNASVGVEKRKFAGTVRAATRRERGSSTDIVAGYWPHNVVFVSAIGNRASALATVP